jgi:hypothetical protein
MGEVGDEALTSAQREEALMAAVWVATRPLADVRPGGLVATAVKTGTHGRMLEEWEFELSQAVLETFPGIFWEAVELTMPVEPTVPVVEPGLDGADGENGSHGTQETHEEPCESCQ